MKIGRFKNGPREFVGRIDQDQVFLIQSADGTAFDSARQAISGIMQGAIVVANRDPIALSDLQLAAPIVQPEKVLCVGRNYAEHATEMGTAVGEIPVVFNKLPSSIIGPNQPIQLPAISDKVDFEAELVVVIGRTARFVEPACAENHVFGYCCGNDVTARDWQKQKPGGQWLLGKSFDTFAPLGPWIVTRDELDHRNLNIGLKLNGQPMQSANTSRLIFGIDYLVSYLSQFCTLVPGDLIFTGTPAGVGAGRDPQVFLQPGDQLEVEIEGLGVLRNPVIGG